MVNEYVYCPRLFWLEYVEREFESSYDTVDGESVHRRVDRPAAELPADIADLRGEATSVELASERLGVVAKLDLIRAEKDGAVPIDFKRGKVPPVPGGVNDPERVQLGIAALLLRENGYRCDLGRIYYAGSKTFVDVPIDESLVAQTAAAIANAREMRLRGSIPAPLVDSPKCGRCSLHAICLPDETNALRASGATTMRPFAARSDDEVPLYVLEPGARVGLSGEVLQVRTDAGIVGEVRLLELGSISLFGNVQISSQAMRSVLQRDIPVFYLSYGGWLSGFARSVNDHSLDLRMAQHEIVQDPTRTLELSRAFVLGKVKNQRTMVRRSLGDSANPALQAMSLLLHRIEHARRAEDLLGFEGAAAQRYFGEFGEMLSIGTGFEVTGRNRRPPTDPINAMLSFGYAMLTKEALAAVVTVGFEPGLGMYHKPRPGRPSLALDLMEEFRPLVVDSTVLTLVNSREIRASHFDRRGKAVVLTDAGRRAFIGAFERRMRSTIRHPTFGYEVTYRRALRVQARLLARAIQRDIPAYPPFCTR
ncbi:MAG: CRISPR-associated endonuclease Cas1 [Candidatus Eremiobacteraeota bacterium]|nr:CRISPR-associated endonuclease Cas1 [Candidatus Eremiobacteraeota bacterium]